MRQTFSAQQKRILALPWVRYVEKPRACSCWRSGTSMTTFWAIRNGTADAALRAKWACKNTAHWHFTALKKSFPDTGVYCWAHLMSRAVFGDGDEEARTNRWYYSHGVYCPSISPNGRRCARLRLDKDGQHHTDHRTQPLVSVSRPETDPRGWHCDEEWVST